MTWHRAVRHLSGRYEWRTGVLVVLSAFMCLSAFGATALGDDAPDGPAHHRAPLVAIGLTWVAITAVVARRRCLTTRQAWWMLLVSLAVIATCALAVPDVRWRWLCAASMPVLPVLAVMHQRGRGLWSLQLLTAAAVSLVLLQTDLTGSYLAYSLGFTVPLSVVPSVVVAALAEALDRARAEAERSARTDPLTGLLNRNGLAAASPALVRAAVDERQRVCVMLLDVDRFKAVNDTFGHTCGDELLRAVASAVRSALRQGDLVTRWGGEEVAVLLALHDDRQLDELAERVRADVAALLLDGLPQVTVSIGTAGASAEQAQRALTGERGPVRGSADLVGQLVDRADTALYRAKASGRDRVVHTASTPVPT